MTWVTCKGQMVRPVATIGQQLARRRMQLQAALAADGKAMATQRTINVMTYNILAQKYAQSGWHNYCPTHHLRWEYRKALLFEEMEAYSSDIICLQEVESDVFSGELQPWLAKRGYQGHYLARQYGEKVQGPPEGVALFYRTDVFELLHHRAFTFSSVQTEPPAPPTLGMMTASFTDSEDSAELGAASTAQARAAFSEFGFSCSHYQSDREAVAAVGAVEAQAHGKGTVSQVTCNRSGSSSDNDEGSSSSIGTDGISNGSSSSEAVVATYSSRKYSSATASPVLDNRQILASKSYGDNSHNNGSSSSGSSGRRLRGGGGNNEFWNVFSRRQEGAILALLRHRTSQRRLLAAVTHLYWNPAFPDVKAFQAAVLCQEMVAFLKRHAGGSNTGDTGNGKGGPSDGGSTGRLTAPISSPSASASTPDMAAVSSDALEEIPIVLAGDFNSLCHKRVPDAFDPKLPRGSDGLVSGVYTLLTHGLLPPNHPDHPAARRRPGVTSNPDFHGVQLTTAGLKLASSYRLANGREPPLTTRTATFAGCLDYIFVSPKHFDVTSTLNLPYELPPNLHSTVRDPLSDVDFPPIPNDTFPSDHLSLVALLRLKG